MLNCIVKMDDGYPRCGTPWHCLLHWLRGMSLPVFSFLLSKLHHRRFQLFFNFLVCLMICQVPGEFIQIRGLNVGVPHKAVVGPCLVIAQEEDNVGRLLRCGGLAERGQLKKSGQGHTEE